MNLNEQQVREFAYQIWESEGRPMGQSERHWDMACKLVASHNEAAPNEFASNPLANGDSDVPSNEPVEPISPGTPQDQPVSDPIQPTEPPQSPAQPIAVAPPRKTRAKAIAEAPKSLIDTNPISLGKPADPHQEPVAVKKSKPRKSKAAPQTAENA